MLGTFNGLSFRRVVESNCVILYHADEQEVTIVAYLRGGQDYLSDLERYSIRIKG